MLNGLDILVVASMGLITAALLSLALMFLVKHPTVRKVCFYVVAALGVYVGTVGLRILSIDFPLQFALAIALGLLSVAAFVVERLSKGDEKKFTIARILAAVALVAGLINAFS